MRVRWSQNFLVDKNIARKCVDALHLQKDENVLEIGAGKGILTEILLEKAKEIVAVEIDPSLCTLLEKSFGQNKHFTLLQKDFLKCSLSRVSALKSKRFKVIGNLPYAVVSPILQKILKWNRWISAVMMVQKEVGERIIAQPGTKDYGILSVSVQSQCRTEKIGLVSHHCFRPMPKVESVILRFSPLLAPVFNRKKEKEFFTVVRASFSHRRKTILNSLSRSMDLPIELIKTAIEKCGFSLTARAETLSISDFKNLSEMLYT